MFMKPSWMKCTLLLTLTLASLDCARPGTRPGADHAVNPPPANPPLLIAHLNDTHSHLEPTPVMLKVEGVDTAVPLGGFARLQTAVAALRAKHPDLLLLHAGDAVQGTLYFSLFHGEVEFDALNRLGVAAMTLGNHEFDRGPKAIPAYLDRAKFPIVSCNIDFSEEPAIGPRVKPFVIQEVEGQSVGIIGATTQETPMATADVGRTRFLDPVAAVSRAAADLEAMGVKRVILLSHLGYPLDRELASRVSGVDIIVGGHSHTLLGDGAALGSLGLKPQGPYPTVVRSPSGAPVLVVQSGHWGQVLGSLSVRFSPGGLVEGFEGRPILVSGEDFQRGDRPVAPGSEEAARIRMALESSGAMMLAEDPAVLRALKPYAERVAAHRHVVLATATQELVRSLNGGPGPLIADSMRGAVPRAEIAILNYGGVRRDLRAGPISQGDVMEVLPFGNALTLMELTGAELRRALEEDLEFLARKFEGVDPMPMPYVSGMRLEVDPRRPAGSRIASMRMEPQPHVLEPLDESRRYLVVVNTFEAGGGDGFETLKACPRRVDTGILDAEAFSAYLQAIKIVSNPLQTRITLVK